MNGQTRRLRTIVCGTTFGQTYLNGIDRERNDFELAGIVARGSAFAHQCAGRFGVPLYTSIADLPPGIDLACVVVRSGVVGGAGTCLAKALLERGIHVLQEQPLHPDELADLLRVARQQGCQYRLNGFYPDVESVAHFIRVARYVLSQRRAIFLDAACSIHVLYPLMDIISQMLGTLRPWSFTHQPVSGAVESVFTCVGGVVGGVPLTLRVQNQLDPRDPDNHIHLFHQISLGTEGGTLTLIDSHGQILWHPRMHLLRRKDGVIDLSANNEALNLSVSTLIGNGEAPSYHRVFNDYWSRATGRALQRFRAEILSGENNPARIQSMLAVCRAWSKLGMQLGPPRAVTPPESLPLAAETILANIESIAGS
ncbi:thiazolinyl imide reductase [Affinibrenneria salicis]|uniref:Thiazolinyl imide reductase n=1 Tax=Affinibrenneria salicis TaxID=2590031 RepID=A0A5J5FT51_9GAMM|nr:Gfo/Idh/MocA family oxidoreductase [Affinibrenneria salicis]KAA8996662.1 thiazolinyl imide reductase [Affinibrenneria salicis]